MSGELLIAACKASQGIEQDRHDLCLLVTKHMTGAVWLD